MQRSILTTLPRFSSVCGKVIYTPSRQFATRPPLQHELTYMERRLRNIVRGIGFVLIFTSSSVFSVFGYAKYNTEVREELKDILPWTDSFIAAVSGEKENILTKPFIFIRDIIWSIPEKVFGSHLASSSQSGSLTKNKFPPTE